MADIELEVLSRAIMVGAIDQLIAAEVEPRHFFDPETRAVFETCAEHYSVWRKSMSLEAVRRHHPDYKIVPSNDELGYLIQEFRYSRALKIGITKALDINEMLEKAERGDREILRRIPELFLEHAREVMALTPMTETHRLSDMDKRIDVTRKQQDAGVTLGVKTGIGAIDQYVGDVRAGEVFVHCGYSGRGKTQGMVRSAISAYGQGDRVLFMPLEMTAQEILEIFDAEAARMSRMALRKRELKDDDYDRWAEAAARVRMAKNDIVIVDRKALGASPTVDKMAAMIERHKTQTNCVDYVSLMSTPTRGKGDDWQRVAEISRDLKAMASVLEVRLYVAAQSAVGAALDGPTEDNIAFSKAIFQDCNVMVGWHETPDMARVNKVQGRLVKNRAGYRGPRGDSGYFEFYEHWDRDRMIFEPWTTNHDWLAKANLGAI